MDNGLYHLFWAKTNRQAKDGLPTRPLWAHLTDVGSVAEILWDGYLPKRQRLAIAASLGLTELQARSLFIFFCALHDVGKAIPSFQALHEESREILANAGFELEGNERRLHHGHASISILFRWIEGLALPKDVQNLLTMIGAFVGFHHGLLLDEKTWQMHAGDPDSTFGPLGNEAWRMGQQAIIEELLPLYQPQIPGFINSENTTPYWLLVVAGWTTLADWAGSIRNRFPDVEATDDLAEYQVRSRKAAEEVVRAIHLDHHSALMARDFTELFPQITEPRPLQRILASLPVPADGTPTLTIVEGPTGEGKTEGSLALAVQQQAGNENRGLFIAMPTQTTSEQMFDRLRKFLQHAHDPAAGDASVRLVHGDALLNPIYNTLLDQRDDEEAWEEIFDPDLETESEHIVRVGTGVWFLKPKMSLLVPYGVATIDQMLLGVLYSKHFFVRLLGLAGKTVIFDEVHAYDHYMTELFVRLLQWLKRLGTHVIILSATLPSRMRYRLIEAWSDEQQKPDENAQAPYPVVWSTDGAKLTCSEFPAHQRQRAELQWCSPDPKIVVGRIVEAACAGATVGVIVNTVARAQNIFALVDNALNEIPGCDIERSLFHARFVREDRYRIQDVVCRRFDKDRPVERPAILVATQVAEQSLDLDFDILFTDLAPVDALLQRGGREHRHAYRPRPTGFENPVVVVLCNECAEDDLPDIGDIGGGEVYDATVVWRTWQELRRLAAWDLPGHYRPLIESVYSEGNEPSGLSEAALHTWETAVKEEEKCILKARREANNRVISHPDQLENIVIIPKLPLRDPDDEKAHHHLMALTRLGPESFDVVCLHQRQEKLYLDPDCKHPIDLASSLTRDDLQSILLRSVRVSHKAIVQNIKRTIYPGWTALQKKTKELGLRSLLIFEDRIWRSDGEFHVHFDTTLGLVIHKEKECKWPDLI
jgi:CRISPR-associated endonuclease/helicase Cas3